MFEKATRLKLRFDSPKGLLSVEDLWDLPLTSTLGKANLDDVARGLHRKVQSNEDVSFVNPGQSADAVSQLKFDLVKHIISVRLAEKEAATQAQLNKEKKQKLLEILDRKQNAAYEALTADEIRKMIESL